MTICIRFFSYFQYFQFFESILAFIFKSTFFPLKKAFHVPQPANTRLLAPLKSTGIQHVPRLRRIYYFQPQDGADSGKFCTAEVCCQPQQQRQSARYKLKSYLQFVQMVGSFPKFNITPRFSRSRSSLRHVFCAAEGHVGFRQILVEPEAQYLLAVNKGRAAPSRRTHTPLRYWHNCI